MLDEKDIQKIIEANREVFPTKEDFAKLVTLDEFDGYRKEIREEFANLREIIQALTVSVDKLAKAVEDMHQEYIAITSKVDRHEKWIQQIAEKLGIKLEY